MNGLHSNRVITPAGITEATIIFDSERIEAVIPGRVSSRGNIISVEDAVIMPGIVDPHVHINEPGRAEWEGFDTATKAALAGGITTLVDMPLNADPVTTSPEALEAKYRSMQGKLHVDCGCWGGIVPGNSHEIEAMIAQGVRGFKAFLTHSGIDEFPNVTEEDLSIAMPLIAKHRLPLLVHCEYESRPAVYDLHDTVSYSNYLASRPDEWEYEAIAMMIRLSEKFNCPIHIVHLSSATALELISNAKKSGLPVTVETGQHYLFFDAEMIRNGQTQFKCAPPIRNRSNNERLWSALKDGLIDFVATDHSPAPPAMKELQSGNFLKAWGGISSLQLALPVLWTAAKRHDCSLHQLMQWLCERPALLPRFKSKGKIQQGYDADLLVWDPEATFMVNANQLYHRHPITPYDGQSLFGVVKQVWLRGEKLFDDGKFLHLNKGNILRSVH